MSTRTDGDQVPLILIHGAWLSARSWENYVDYLGTRGFAVSAPEWPRKHGDVEEIREPGMAQGSRRAFSTRSRIQSSARSSPHPKVSAASVNCSYRKW
jgi:pimeloyl-ACP methyl ester carboxylesterase